MISKELSVWDVMNGVSEEDAKQEDDIVVAEARRIITMPCSRGGVNANGVMYTLEDPQTEIPLGNVAIPELGDWDVTWDAFAPENTGSYEAPTVGYPPFLDRIYSVDANELRAALQTHTLYQVVNTHVVRFEPDTGEYRMLDPRYVLNVYDDHYELLDETSGLSCEISTERLLYAQHDEPPSAFVTPRGEVLQFDEVIAVAHPH